jgi:hypothetical protein
VQDGAHFSVRPGFSSRQQETLQALCGSSPTYFTSEYVVLRRRASSFKSTPRSMRL